MLFRKLLEEKDNLIFFTSFLIGLMGILGVLFELHIVFITFIIFSMCFLQLFIFINSKKRRGLEQQILLEDIPLPVIVTTKGKIHNLNKSTVHLLGAINKKELIGKSIFEFITTSPEQEDIPLQVATNQKVQLSIAGKLTSLNGQKLDVEVLSGNITSYPSDNVIECYVIKDISEFIESKKKLHHSEQLSVLGELAAGIAHEIRNPLTSLKGFLQLSTSTKNDRGVYTDIMLSEIDRINLIVGELLLLSKPKEMVFTSSHLLTLIKTVVTIVNTQAILYNIEIITKIDNKVKDLKIRCEENKLKQVFINILKNGIEAMQKEGKMYIEINIVNDHVHITFIDEGKGISEENLEQLGKRFYSTKENGTGLGLMISFNIIHNHKGKMNITSEVGKGTAIEIILPVTQ